MIQLSPRAIFGILALAISIGILVVLVLKRNNNGTLNPKTSNLKNQSITVGANHSLVLLNGVVRGCGSNENSQLGLNESVEKESVPKVIRTLGNDNIDIAAAANHSFVIKQNGSVMAFGENTYGQLGDGTTNDILKPTTVRDLGNDNKQISANRTHTLVLKQDGRVYSFGSNNKGQLGLGTNTDSFSPQYVSALGDDNVQVSAGDEHSLVLKKSGQVFGFGKNETQQLGDGTKTNQSTPNYASILKDDNAQISAGNLFSLALKKNGSVLAFGYNWFHQLGTLGFVESNLLSGSFKQVHASNKNSSLLLTTAGRVFAMGENDYGKLGFGSLTDSEQNFIYPTEMLALGDDNVEFALDQSHSLFLQSDGRILACGQNVSGETGTGLSDISVIKPHEMDLTS